MEEKDLQEAINVINYATQPNVRLTRADYVKIDECLGLIAEALNKTIEEREEKVE